MSVREGENMSAQRMKGITCCADCAYYKLKKHRCVRCIDEGKPTDRFYADCPLPEVSEIKVGKWKKINNPNYSGFDGRPEQISICSECKYAIEHDFLYCPNCGAKMEGVNE